MTRHIGAFIQNVLKPTIEQLDELLGKCKNLGLDGQDIHIFIQSFLVYSLVRFKLVLICLTIVSLFAIGCYFFTR